MKTIEVAFNNSQPVHLLGNTEKPEQVWVLCHGYAQTASEFSDQFKDLDIQHVLLAFPESLSRFYHRGHSGRVVGSWMTRLYRELDIRNQNEYISAVWKDLERNGFLREGTKRIGFGFSQGGATMARWADQNHSAIDELIIWGCRFPPDLQDQHMENFRDDHLVRSFIGDQDPFFPPEQLKQFRQMFSGVKNLDWNIYEGGHQLRMDLVQSLISS